MTVEGHLTPDARAALLHALAWQIELGADECVGEAPADRFKERAAAPKVEPQRAAPDRSAGKPAAVAPRATQAAPAVTRPAEPEENTEVVTEARRLAAAASDLGALHEAMKAFDGGHLKAGARSTVFSDGNAAARVMLIGEAPGRDEDREGKPFVGRSGQLLDRMLAAIGLDRRSEDPATAAYIANVLPWRPVGDRDPTTAEAQALWAFLQRHIELAAPEIIVALGRAPAAALTEEAIRITRVRGQWRRPERAGGRPLLLTLHPAYLLRQPGEKAKAWRDLLALRAVLDGAEPRLQEDER